MSKNPDPPPPPPPAAFLTGKRCLLRPLVPADVDGPYAAWFNDPLVCQFNSHHRWPMTRESLLSYIEQARSRRDLLVLAICFRDGTHIGNVSLQQINQVDRSAEFAIIIGERAAWGTGIGFEAASLILKHGFQHLGLHRVHCGTSAENAGMRRLAAKLGFIEEGRRREALFKGGRHIDVVEFGLLQAEYPPDPSVS